MIILKIEYTSTEPTTNWVLGAEHKLESLKESLDVLWNNDIESKLRTNG